MTSSVSVSLFPYRVTLFAFGEEFRFIERQHESFKIICGKPPSIPTATSSLSSYTQWWHHISVRQAVQIYACTESWTVIVLVRLYKGTTLMVRAGCTPQ